MAESLYPEHERQAHVVERTQAIGEFIEWLESQGVQLMVYREDLKDYRPTDPECDSIRRRHDPEADCDPDESLRGKPLEAYWRTHCKHWHDRNREAEDGALHGVCCRCGKGREYEITTRGWVHEQRGTEQLLADWAGIDLSKIEAEKRQMLASIRAMNETANHG